MADVDNIQHDSMTNGVSESEDSPVKSKVLDTSQDAGGAVKQAAVEIIINGDVPTIEHVSEDGGASQEKVLTPDEAAPAEPEVHDDAQQKSADIQQSQQESEPASPPVTSQQEIVVQTSSDKPADAEKKTTHDVDEVIPCDNLFTWHRDEAVKLRMGEGGLKGRKPYTVVTAFQNTLKKAANNMAMAHKRNGQWVKWTFQEYYNTVIKTAKSFIKLGLEPYHGVGIVGFNCPEWFFADLGAIWAGGLACGIYTTNSPEACQFVASDCEANIIVVENNAQLQKILKVEKNLPHLKAIVQWSGEVVVKKDNVYTWEEFLRQGEDVPDSAIQERMKCISPNKCCTLIYTSGTTGNPKGVMISHDNITWTAECMAAHMGLTFGDHCVISYLPLSHIAAQMLDLHCPVLTGTAVWFAQPDALKGSLGDTMKEVRPTVFLGVPRVWEKIEEKLKAAGAQTSGIKKKIGTWAKSVGYKHCLSKMNGGSAPFGYGIANSLVFKKVKAATGLDRCKYMYTAAAPITEQTVKYFMHLDIRICEIYGMSESSGPHTCSIEGEWRIGTVGKEVPGFSTVLADKDQEGNGEICMIGRHVFMGYLGQEEKTKDALDEEGLLHSGDIGKYDENGFLHITGRIKEIIITAGGENVAPVPIEDNIKEELPCVSNCMLIGDKRKFLSMLVALKTKVDFESGEPLGEFTPETVAWCKSVGSQATKVSDVIDNKDLDVLKAIQDGFDRANKKSVSNAQKVQKWTILPKDFSIPGGELGPTLKLKRPVVHKQYADTIEAFY